MNSFNDLILRIPRAILFRFEMRMRHAIAVMLASNIDAIHTRLAHLTARVDVIHNTGEASNIEAIHTRLAHLVERVDVIHDTGELTALQVLLMSQRLDLVEYRIVDLATSVTQVGEGVNAVGHSLSQELSGFRFDVASTRAEAMRNGRRMQLDVAGCSARVDVALSKADRLDDRLVGLSATTEAISTALGEVRECVAVACASLAGLNAVTPRLDEIARTLEQASALLATLQAGVAPLPTVLADTAAQMDASAQKLTRIGGVLRDVSTGLEGLRTVVDASAASAVASADAIPSLAGQASATAAAVELVRQLAQHTLDRRQIALSDELVATATPYGWIVVPKEEAELLVHLSNGTSYHEPGLAQLVGGFLGPGDVAIDVGAHVGLLTVPMARAVGRDGRVFAVEPQPRLSQALAACLRLNDLDERVDLTAAAAGARSGEMPLFEGANAMMASLYAEREGQPWTTVPVITLDDMVKDARVNLVKIDAEGAELDILKGMRRLLKRSPEIIVIAEMGPQHIARAHRSVADWFGVIRSLGLTGAYETDDLAGGLRTLPPLAELEAGPTRNIVFSQAAQEARLARMVKS